MVLPDPLHMPMHHGLPLIDFLSEILIFMGIFVTLSSFLETIKASNKMSIFIGIIILAIGCFIYVITKNESSSSFTSKKMNYLYNNNNIYNEPLNRRIRQYHTQ